MSESPPRAGDADSGRLLAMGPPLLVRFSALLRTARTHDVSNEAFRRQLRDFMVVLLQAMEEEDEVALVAVADYLYLNGVRLKASAALLTVYHSLIEEFERRSLGGVRFLQGVTPAAIESARRAASRPGLAPLRPADVVQLVTDRINAFERQGLPPGWERRAADGQR